MIGLKNGDPGGQYKSEPEIWADGQWEQSELIFVMQSETMKKGQLIGAWSLLKIFLSREQEKNDFIGDLLCQ